MSSRLSSDGGVAITINSKEHMLQATPKALDLVSAQYGGLQKSHELIVARNYSAMVFIINAGLNFSGRAAAAMAQEVWEHGINNDLIIPLVKYNAILGNGGRPLPDPPIEDEGAAVGNG